MKIILPNRDTPIVDSRGIPTLEFFGWMMAVSDALNAREIMIGIGSPEGVVKAPITAQYLNTSNGDLYIKTTNTGSTGWRLI